jgi:hypothetical protein
MALEMRVHRDPTNYDAKPMFGLTWRQIAALAIMVFGGGGLFLIVTVIGLHTQHASWGDSAALSKATTPAMYLMFPILVPAAMWGWIKPMGLKPEIYFQYFLRHQLTTKVVTYADSYHHRTAAAAPGERTESVLEPEQPSEQHRHRVTDRERRKQEARLRKALSEHAPHSPQRTRRPGHTARQAEDRN